VAARGGYDLMPEQGCKPTNKYLPPRPREDKDLRDGNGAPAALAPAADDIDGAFLRWVDRLLSR
jgi:hypothetical protein